MKNSFMKYMGVVLIVVGTLLLLAFYITRLQTNTLLLVALAIIVTGAVFHVFALKRSSNY
ncbi:MAG: hypothetical protein IJP74_12840 [Prevotella sp.]|nr:hypothetical protein [Prevotella sp.]